MKAGPLAGLRVVERSTGTAAAFCAKILADLGAHVALVEPDGGHPGRRAAPRRADGVSARFAYLNTGKTSVPVTGDEQVTELLAGADVLVTDDEPDRIPRLLPVGADVVVVGIRPFGATGPNARHRAHHLTVFHAGGEGSLLPSGLGWQEFPDRAPIQLGSEIGWFDAGWNAAVAALGACFELVRSGTAQHVDVSVQESQLTLNRTRLSRFTNDGVVLGREPSRYGNTGMLRCHDGWVQLVGLRDEHWDRLVALPQGAELAQDPGDRGEVLARWCAARPKAEVAELLAAAGAPVGAHRTAEELLASEQLRHRRFFHDLDDGAGGLLTLPGVPYRFSRTPVVVRPAPGIGEGEPAPPPLRRGDGPLRLLEGIRVLDFTWAAAGPYATLLLALMGAEVVKVESSRRPDPARRGFLADYGGVNRSPNFNELNLNKRSLQVDLTHAAGRAVVDDLVGGVDVVVDNFRPGVMDRFGLGAATLLTRHPGLVVASSSANGSTGPDAMAAGFASVFGATGGLSEQTGYPDGPPTEVGESTDYRSANALAVGIIAALIHRARTGEGQHVDVSSCEVVVASAPDALLAHVVGAPWAPRIGNAHRELAPHDVYPCLDGGWVAIAAGDEAEWSGLCRALGRPRWVALYPSAEARRGATEIDDAITAWTRTRRAGDATRSLQSAGVPAGPVMTNAELAADPHLAARGVLVEVEHPEIGRQTVMRAPWRFSHSDCSIHRHGPLLGGDTDEVLSGLASAALDDPTFQEAFR